MDMISPYNRDQTKGVAYVKSTTQREFVARARRRGILAFINGTRAPFADQWVDLPPNDPAYSHHLGFARASDFTQAYIRNQGTMWVEGVYKRTQAYLPMHGLPSLAQFIDDYSCDDGATYAQVWAYWFNWLMNPDMMRKALPRSRFYVKDDGVIVPNNKVSMDDLKLLSSSLHYAPITRERSNSIEPPSNIGELHRGFVAGLNVDTRMVDLNMSTTLAYVKDMRAALRSRTGGQQFIIHYLDKKHIPIGGKLIEMLALYDSPYWHPKAYALVTKAYHTLKAYAYNLKVGNLTKKTATSSPHPAIVVPPPLSEPSQENT